MRSDRSKLSNPVLPSDENAIKVTVKEGMFKSDVDKNYIFMYQIHTDGDPQNNYRFNRYPKVCWSMFVKPNGKKAEVIWKYHRFNDETLEELYPWFKNSENSDTLR